MAAGKVTEHFDGRRATDGENGEVTFRRVFTVHGTTMHEDISDVASAVDPNDPNMRIPSIGDSHPENSDAICVSVEPVQRTDSPWLWTVTTEYSTFGLPEFQDPLLRRPITVYSQEDRQIVAEIADRYSMPQQDGVPVVNSAGDLFDPPIMDDDPILVLTVTKNEAKFPRDKVVSFLKTKNASTWNKWSPGAAKLVSITGGDAKREWGKWYRPITYVFHIREFVFGRPQGAAVQSGGWLKHILDVGMNELDDNDKKRRIRSGVDGNQFGNGSPLNGFGKALTEEEIKAGAFQYIIYSFNKPKEWNGANGLGLDSLPE